MANPCKNFLFEPDGYCTQCGKNHFTVSAGEVKFIEAEPKVEDERKVLVEVDLAEDFHV